MARMTLDELVSQLKAAFGSGLRSVVLYGSSAAGGETHKHSDQNVLVIVDSLEASHLVAASATSRAWSEAGHPAPLTFTASEWRGSSDIFPMEYADILERNRVLYGEAPFDGIHVDLKDLRLQLEQEAMGKLLKLRQGLLASGNDEKRQLELLAASRSAIMIIFRAFLRLHGTKPSKDNVELAEAVARQAGFDPAPFVRVIGHVRGDTGIDAAEAPKVLAAYMDGMQKVVSYLDHYQPVG